MYLRGSKWNNHGDLALLTLPKNATLELLKFCGCPRQHVDDHAGANLLQAVDARSYGA